MTYGIKAQFQEALKYLNSRSEQYAQYLARQLTVLNKFNEQEKLSVAIESILAIKNGTNARNMPLRRIFVINCFSEKGMPELAKLSGEYTNTELKEMFLLALNFFKDEHTHQKGHIAKHGNNYHTMKVTLRGKQYLAKELLEDLNLLNEFIEMNNETLQNEMKNPKSNRGIYEHEYDGMICRLTRCVEESVKDDTEDSIMVPLQHPTYVTVENSDGTFKTVCFRHEETDVKPVSYSQNSNGIPLCQQQLQKEQSNTLQTPLAHICT